MYKGRMLSRAFAAALVLTATAGSATDRPAPLPIGLVVTATPYWIYDGDTFWAVVDGMKRPIRLHGVDAHEIGQVCTSATGHEYPCGKLTRDALAAMLGQEPRGEGRGLAIAAGKPLRCTVIDRDTRWDRSVARCELEGRDIARELVAAGYGASAKAYSAEFGAAAREGRGFHALQGFAPANDPVAYRRRGS